MRRQRLPGRALVPITWGMRRALGTAAGPRTHARLPGAPSPARRSPSPPAPAGARAQGTPNSPRLGRWSPNFLRGGCPQPWLVVGRCREAAPGLPGVAERGAEDAAAGGSDGRRGSAELRWDQPRLKFLLSRCRSSGSIACGFPPPSPRLPVSSLSSPAREDLKGPRGPFPASLYTLQTLVWQVLLINISIHKPGVPDCALR